MDLGLRGWRGGAWGCGEPKGGKLEQRNKGPGVGELHPHSLTHLPVYSAAQQTVVQLTAGSTMRHLPGWDVKGTARGGRGGGGSVGVGGWGEAGCGRGGGLEQARAQREEPLLGPGQVCWAPTSAPHPQLPTPPGSSP